MERDLIEEIAAIRDRLLGIYTAMAQDYPDEQAEINTAIQVLQNVSGDMRRTDTRRRQEPEPPK